jgi:3-phenylpropionate/trans-cinnamate dioxygenase ferredoxin subunit
LKKERTVSEFVRVGAVADFEAGTLYDRVVGGKHVAIVRNGERFYAMLNACTHAGYFLTPGELLADGSVYCPGHGAVFRLPDGAPTEGPAGDALDMYEVRVDGENVLVGPPSRSARD